MEPLFILALISGVYMAWNIGANDVANAMGTSVGARSLTLFKAVIFAAIFEFAGAFLVGAHVSQTVQTKIVDPSVFAANPQHWVYGMLAALLAAGAWLQVASYFGWPVSTTHSIIGAVLGFGLIVGGVDAIHWPQVTSIVASWAISPFLGGILSFFVFSIMRRQIFYARDPVQATKRLAPYLIFVVVFVLALMVVFKGLKNLHLNLSFSMSLGMAIGLGVLAALIGHFFVKRLPDAPHRNRQEGGREKAQVMIGLGKACKHLERVRWAAESEEIVETTKEVLAKIHDVRKKHHFRMPSEELSAEYSAVERVFSYLQVLSACALAFAHGANDVANSIGPFSAAVQVIQTGSISFAPEIPLWILTLGASGIVVGLATWGWRVIETIGKRITELTPTRGFAAEFGAAITIVIASKMGLPISTTHTLVGAVLGVGLARGINAINLNTLRDIALSWIVTIPAGAGLSILFFYSLKGIFG